MVTNITNGVSEHEFAPKSDLTLVQALVGFNNVFIKNNMVPMKIKIAQDNPVRFFCI